MGLCLYPGNDCAVAIAEHIGGSVEGFAELMNEKAAELGCKDTHFVTPHGLDRADHYTTAYELAIIANYALKNPIIADIAKTKTINITIDGESRQLNNTNPLLGGVDGVDGLKTGFTSQAMYCIVTSVTRGNMQITCVILGADNKPMRNRDDLELISYAYAKYEMIDLSPILEQEWKTWSDMNERRIDIIKGVKSTPNLGLEEKKIPLMPIRKEDVKDITANFQCLNTTEAPIYKGEVMGNYDLKIKDKTLYTGTIISEINIEKKNGLNYFYEILSHLNAILETSF